MSKPQRKNRSKAEIARDRALVAEYHVQGLNFVQIADELNNRPGIEYAIKPDTVSRDYRANITMWNERAMTPTQADIEMQKERLRVIEVQAWSAWRRSMDPAESVRTIEKMQDIFDENGEVIDQVLATAKVDRLIKGQTGDPRFLTIVLDAWDKRAKLDGMYVTKLQIDSRHEETKTVNIKMYKNVSPNMWDDPQLQVIDGQIVRNGDPVDIVDGEIKYLEGDG